VSLEEAIAKAKGELAELKAEEAAQLETSGIRTVVEQLTAENQALTARRAEARRRLAELEQALTRAREHGAMLELQIKGARSRVQKLHTAERR
jgi:hypothetical protein